MARPTKFFWPAIDNQAVALPQTLAAAGNLSINGTLSVNSQINGGTASPVISTYYAEFPGILRAVTLTSTGNLTGVNFTITGYVGNNILESVVIAGPNNGTVTTATQGVYFNKVISIAASAAVGTNVSAGTGTTGYTLWFRSDYNRIKADLTVAVAITVGTATYTFQTTLDDIDAAGNGAVAIWNTIEGITTPTIPTASPMINATDSIIADYTFPTNASRIFISASDATTQLIIWFLQQGIN